MKSLFKIVFFLLCVHIANAQTPVGTPTINSPGWARYRWVQADSGQILPVRDTNWLPRFPTAVLWQNAGVDTAIWVFNGIRPWKRLSSGGDIATNVWFLNGNTIDNSTQQFIGTLNNRAFRIRTNDIDRVIVDSSQGRLSVIDGPDSLSISPLLIKASGSTDLGISTGGFVSVNILNNGFVGIGNNVQPQERLHVEGNVLSTDAFILKNPLTPFLAEVANEGDEMSIRTISPDGILFKTNNTLRGQFASTGEFSLFNVAEGSTSDSILTKTIGGEIRKIGPFASTASNGLTKVGNDIQLGGALLGVTKIATEGYDLNLSGSGRLLIDTGRIVVGLEVDPLYPLTVKKIYDNVTQANFATTVGKYPIYADKDVRFTEDSISMWPVSGDNSGLSILRYKGRSILNFENNINRFTASHSVIAFDKYPGFSDTTIVMGRTSPLIGISAPTGFAGIHAFGGSGTVNAPILGKGWFSALSAEFIVSGNPTYNNVENAIWLHTGIHGSGGANSVKNGYGVFINGFNNSVTNKYALYQQGTLDTVQLNGKIKIPNLVIQSDTNSYKPTVIDANGNLFKLSYWPTGSSGGSGTVTDFVFTDANGFDGTVSTSTTTPTLSLTTSLTTGSVLFIGASGALTEDNTNFYWDNTNKRHSIGSGTSPVARLSVTTDNLGGTSTSASHTSSGLLLSNTTAAANGSQQISPALVLRGQGWGTTAGTSQTVDWRFINLPTQGATAGSSLRLQFVNGPGPVSEPFLFNAIGQLNLVTLVASGGVSGTTITGTSNVTAGSASVFQWTGRSTIRSEADGNVRISNNAGNDLGLIQGGGTTASFPAFQRSGTNWIARLADNSANTDIEVLDEAYGVSWDGSNEVPTKNAVYDKIETLAGVNTLYTGDGTATNRTVTVSGYLNLTGGEVKIGSSTDRGLYPFQNTGSIYQAGLIVQAESGATYPYMSAIDGTSKKWFIGTFKDGVVTQGLTVDTFNNVNTGSLSTALYPNYSTGGNLFIGGAALQAGESYGSWTTITSDATLSAGYGFTTILIDATAGNITITLPVSSTVSNGSGGSLSTGILYKFKRIDNSGNTVTIQTQGSDLIDGNSSLTMPTQWLIQHLQAAGTDRWIVI